MNNKAKYFNDLHPDVQDEISFELRAKYYDSFSRAEVELALRKINPVVTYEDDKYSLWDAHKAAFEKELGVQVAVAPPVQPTPGKQEGETKEQIKEWIKDYCGDHVPNYFTLNEVIDLVKDYTIEQPPSPTESARGKEDRACPCLYLEEPCHPRCTCTMGGSSTGCMFCCTYGSLEQRKAAAKRIAQKIKASSLPAQQIAGDALRKLGDDMLTELKKDPNHITTQLNFNEQVSYNTGFHKGFELGYRVSAPAEGYSIFLDSLTDEQRMDIFNKYCKHCGSKDSGCQCWNDD